MTADSRVVQRMAEIIHAAECTAYVHMGRNARCEREARALAEAGIGVLADARAEGAQAVVEAVVREFGNRRRNGWNYGALVDAARAAARAAAAEQGAS